MNENIESTVENLEVVAGEENPTESAPTGTDTAVPQADLSEPTQDENSQAEGSQTVAAEEPVAESNVSASAEEVSSDETSSESVESVSEQAEAGLSEEAEPTNEQSDDGSSEEDDSNVKKVVRTLAVGQEISGVVKRITDFGAFVDIGVGRDGLIHISELSVRRVGKVGDMLKEGQEIEGWIKKLDRERNRINLTMISPETKTIRDLEKDALITGKVTRVLPYGVFVDIGVERDALLHIREMSDGFINKPEDLVAAGDELEARIINISRRRGRVDLSLKGLGPEPDPEEKIEERRYDERRYEEKQAQEPEVQEPVVKDPYAEVEVLSPMELAFKKAMEGSDSPIRISAKRQNKRKRREETSSVQDDIVTRTLDVDL